MGTTALSELVTPDYVEGRADLPLEEIRTRRANCQSAEEVLSLQRRMVQGRLDIVLAEIDRRRGHPGPTEAHDLVAELPAILVEHGARGPGKGRLATVGGNHAELDAEFDRISAISNSIVSADKLSELHKLEDSELQEISTEMGKLERSISEHRHQLHRNIDSLQEEIVRRYKSGEASVDSWLGSES